MIDSAQTVVLQTSRLKALQNAMFVMAALAVFGYFISLPIYSILTEAPAHGWWIGIFFVSLIMIAILALIRMLRPVVHPDILTLSVEGWNETRFGQASTYQWSDFGTATKQIISRGRGGTSTYVRLEPKDGGKAVLIRGSEYAYPFDVVLSAVQQAQAGRLTRLEPARTSVVSAFLVTPAIAIIYVTLVLYGWHSLHRPAPTREARATDLANDGNRVVQYRR